MSGSTGPDHTVRQLHCGVVLRVREDECEVLSDGRLRHVRYAPMFPSPRTERVQPGNIVAMTAASIGIEIVLWRWYDAVVLGDDNGAIRLWDPAHGEVLAQPRAAYRPVSPGSRAYLSAGLPGADWWVAGPTVAEAHDADVELDEVVKLYTQHGLWDTLE
jgi:hypothetical protein